HSLFKLRQEGTVQPEVDSKSYAVKATGSARTSSTSTIQYACDACNAAGAAGGPANDRASRSACQYSAQRRAAARRSPQQEQAGTEHDQVFPGKVIPLRVGFLDRFDQRLAAAYGSIQRCGFIHGGSPKK